MKIMIDLDGVAANFSGASIEKFGPCNPKIYNLEKRWPDRIEEIRQFVQAPQTYEKLKAIRGAIRGWNELVLAGHQILVCTSRPDGTEEVTKSWLDAKKLPYSQMIFVPWSSHQLKGDVLAGQNVDLAIEDDLKQAASLQQAGIPVILLARPWNKQGWRTGFLDATSWPDAVQQIAEIGPKYSVKVVGGHALRREAANFRV
jgi:Uncharacterized conserved protein